MGSAEAHIINKNCPGRLLCCRCSRCRCWRKVTGLLGLASSLFDFLLLKGLSVYLINPDSVLPIFSSNHRPPYMKTCISDDSRWDLQKQIQVASNWMMSKKVDYFPQTLCSVLYMPWPTSPPWKMSSSSQEAPELTTSSLRTFLSMATTCLCLRSP